MHGATSPRKMAEAMYQLYYYPSNANLAPHMLLEELGVPFELVLVDRDRNEHKGAEYLKLNPSGRIPVLVDGDLVLSETAAICLHLVDRHPQAGFTPALGTPERGQSARASTWELISSASWRGPPCSAHSRQRGWSRPCTDYAYDPAALEKARRYSSLYLPTNGTTPRGN